MYKLTGSIVTNALYLSDDKQILDTMARYFLMQILYLNTSNKIKFYDLKAFTSLIFDKNINNCARYFQKEGTLFLSEIKTADNFFGEVRIINNIKCFNLAYYTKMASTVNDRINYFIKAENLKSFQ